MKFTIKNIDIILPLVADAAFATALSLDQIEVFVEVARAGSFSAAARNLRRAQGSISYHISSLEQQIGVELFDRSQRPPALTESGFAVLRLARQVAGDIQELRQLAWQLGDGLEPRIRLAVDVLFPPTRLAEILAELGRRFEAVDLVVSTGIVDFASEQVLAGEADLGVAGPIGLRRDLVQIPCFDVEMVPVAAPSHPLASGPQPVSDGELKRHVHLLLSRKPSPRSEPSTGFSSPRRWYIRDSYTRRVLLVAGLGWARLPHSEVASDLAAGRLARFEAEAFGGRTMTVPLAVIHRRDALLGKATRWLRDRLAHRDDPATRS